MGDRGQVKIGGVTLYTHWGGYTLKADVQRAIAKKWRWGDTSYLTRIIFDEMKGDDRGETGFGISVGNHSDAWITIEVNDTTKEIEVLENDKPTFRGSYEEFIELEIKE
jgi:hypothetical protein